MGKVFEDELMDLHSEYISLSFENTIRKKRFCRKSIQPIVKF